MNGVLYRFTFKENSYDQMDHPPGLRVGTDRMRYCQHWTELGILVGHGHDLRRIGYLGHLVVAEFFRLLGQLWLQFQHAFQQPEQHHVAVIGKPELGSVPQRFVRQFVG